MENGIDDNGVTHKHTHICGWLAAKDKIINPIKVKKVKFKLCCTLLNKISYLSLCKPKKFKIGSFV